VKKRRRKGENTSYNRGETVDRVAQGREEKKKGGAKTLPKKILAKGGCTTWKGPNEGKRIIFSKPEKKKKG